MTETAGVHLQNFCPVVPRIPAFEKLKDTYWWRWMQCTVDGTASLHCCTVSVFVPSGFANCNLLTYVDYLLLSHCHVPSCVYTASRKKAPRPAVMFAITLSLMISGIARISREEEHETLRKYFLNDIADETHAMNSDKAIGLYIFPG